jgi:exopolyphosphatase/guanosine-5'-triphosphate,3'-diphosphate pyrophosphatase
MPDLHAVASVGRIAVVDVGSNSLRLVVFERLGASLLPLLNEKVMCALGRGIARTGRLNPDGVELAFANLQRFVALARALGVDHLAIIATAAVREASDGRAFAAEAERQLGVPVRIVEGAKARLSAAGRPWPGSAGRWRGRRSRRRPSSWCGSMPRPAHRSAPA